MLLSGFDKACCARAVVAACVMVAIFGAFAIGASANEIKGAHGRAGLTCSNCHGDDATPSRPAIGVCLGCHVSYDAIAAKTAHLEPNPHKSHQGELRCTYCHSAHDAPKLYCNECHDFKHLNLK